MQKHMDHLGCTTFKFQQVAAFTCLSFWKAIAHFLRCSVFTSNRCLKTKDSRNNFVDRNFSEKIHILQPSGRLLAVPLSI